MVFTCVGLVSLWIPKSMDAQIPHIKCCKMAQSLHIINFKSSLLIIPNTMQMICQELPVNGKFRFCFLKLYGCFLFKYFLSMIEHLDADPMDMEGKL